MKGNDRNRYSSWQEIDKEMNLDPWSAFLRN